MIDIYIDKGTYAGPHMTQEELKRLLEWINESSVISVSSVNKVSTIQTYIPTKKYLFIKPHRMKPIIRRVKIV